MTEQQLPKVGDPVRVVTSDYTETWGLVTAVHGPGYERNGEYVMPLINLVYVSPDAHKSDSYGRQIERDMTSVQHFNQTQGMPKPGRYYALVTE